MIGKFKPFITCILFMSFVEFSFLSVKVHTPLNILLSGRNSAPCCKAHATTYNDTVKINFTLYCITHLLYHKWLFLWIASYFGHIRTTSGQLCIDLAACENSLHYWSILCTVLEKSVVGSKICSDITSICCQVLYCTITTVCNYQWHVSHVNSAVCLKLETCQRA